MIRNATEDDIPGLLAMAEKFHAASGFADKIIFDPGSVEATIRHLIDNDGGAVFVVDDINRSLLGMIGGMLTHSFVNKNVAIVGELAWWIEPEHRHGTVAIRLLQAFEQWASLVGAKFISMASIESTSPDGLDTLYKRLGYTPTERTYMKEL